MKKNSAGTDHAVVAAIYLDAAKLFEDGKVKDTGQGACSAIAEAMNPTIHHSLAYDKERHAEKSPVHDFTAIFSPNDDARYYWGDGWGDTQEERNNARVVALCFMAAMVEAGDA